MPPGFVQLPTVTITAPGAPSVRPAPSFPYLRPASWKSVPFGIFDTDLAAGRKLAIHQYFNRDEQWPEDLGRKGRSLRIEGFLLDGGGQYGGQGSIQGQADQMLRICESAGPGDLVHPLFGRLTMQLETVEFRHAKEPGLVRLRFEFTEYGKPLYPQIAADTQAQSQLSGFALLAAAAQSWSIGFTEAVHTALGDGAVGSTLGSWTSIANTAATSATSLVTMVGILPGEFGRFVGQTVSDQQKVASSVEELSGLGASGRESVQSAVSALQSAAAGGQYVSAALSAEASAAAAGTPQTPSTAVLSASGVVDVPSGVQAVVQAIQGANPDPAAQVQACLTLANFAAVQQASAEQTAANAAASALCRRMSLAGAAQSSASYVPTSQQDAAGMRDQIVTAIDAEMIIAGDAGDDPSYLALRDLRSAVASDLGARGASLPRSVQVGFSGPLPALVLAWRLYQDVTRDAELVHEADPVSPLFMPKSFQALAS